MLTVERTSPRNGTVDFLRYVAAFGVVLIHLAPATLAAEKLTRTFALFAVPYFTVISLFYFLGKREVSDAPPGAALRASAMRILVPYVAWSLVYLGLRFVKARVQGVELLEDWVGIACFGRASIQLYFLPLLFLFQMIALGVDAGFRRVPGRNAALVFALVALIVGIWAEYRQEFGFVAFVPAATCYVGGALILRATQRSSVGCRLNLWIGSFLVLGFILGTWGDLIPYAWASRAQALAGYGLAALALNARKGIQLQGWNHSGNAFGIFLSHVLFLEAMEFSADRFGLHLLPYSVGTKLIAATVIVLLSLGLVRCLRRNALLATCFLGEPRR